MCRARYSPIALNRKKALFVAHGGGAENRATVASLIETCKLNAVDSRTSFAATLTATATGHRQSYIDELRLKFAVGPKARSRFETLKPLMWLRISRKAFRSAHLKADMPVWQCNVAYAPPTSDNERVTLDAPKN